MGRVNSEGWEETSASNPCPICGRHGWCCIGERFINCMKTEQGGKPCANGGWLFKRTDIIDNPPPQRDRTNRPRLSDAALHRFWQPIVDESFQNGLDRLDQLAVQLGVSTESLVAMRVGYSMLQGESCWTFPERNAHGLYLGINRRFADGTKKYVRGGRRGLSYADDWQRKAGPIMLVEGGSDVAAGLTRGFCVVGRPSNVGGIPMLATLLRPFPNRRILFIGERDKKSHDYVAGMFPDHDPNCRCCQRCYPGLYGAVSSMQRLQRLLPKHKIGVQMPPGNAKDLREYVRKSLVEMV